MRKILVSSLLVLSAAIAGCSDGVTVYAPVTDVSTIEHIPQNGVYRVGRGETLYSIAWRYGLDYRYVASRNHISPPYTITPGQKIYLRGKTVARRPSTIGHVAMPQPVALPDEPEVNVHVSGWRKPAKGPVIAEFSTFNKGINIAGAYGAPIYATANGQVVYSGNGIRGYGNLIIVKHNSAYLSAYAYCSHVLVREGQNVVAGQRIAMMGHGVAQRPMLHFEIRRNGKPVNPLSYLAGRS